jgi:hypothetical protein
MSAPSSSGVRRCHEGQGEGHVKGESVRSRPASRHGPDRSCSAAEPCALGATCRDVALWSLRLWSRLRTPSSCSTGRRWGGVPAGTVAGRGWLGTKTPRADCLQMAGRTIYVRLDSDNGVGGVGGDAQAAKKLVTGGMGAGMGQGGAFGGGMGGNDAGGMYGMWLRRKLGRCRVRVGGLWAAAAKRGVSPRGRAPRHAKGTQRWDGSLPDKTRAARAARTACLPTVAMRAKRPT